MITYYKDYYQQIYESCYKFNDIYYSKKRNIKHSEIIACINSWIKDFENNESFGIGIGPEFSDCIKQIEQKYKDNKANDDEQTNIEKIWMIESAYRDFILGKLDYDETINYFDSDYTVKNKIYNILKSYILRC